ncbi:hypothetical protein PKB_2633 [Pseudomonas knackmussii B13]|uniref:Uncharacterized protein n=1 Tax=Pseudomonas knackmussii (strain DSM 6978 / CCUG 54928 / LMG 23759 / B13) TaxID=1301098 RepID=A0A024HG24_PSEKB|nr:DUF5908 family protein [Pseudomonas knackmussii]CDF83980.1 hypothetical protein PKB_2633 [Pseudomonas knackmussii B13]
MPVFINEVVIRSTVDQPLPASGQQPTQTTGTPVDREALVAEVTQRVIDYLERELDRIGER